MEQDRQRRRPDGNDDFPVAQLHASRCLVALCWLSFQISLSLFNVNRRRGSATMPNAVHFNYATQTVSSGRASPINRVGNLSDDILFITS